MSRGGGTLHPHSMRAHTPLHTRHTFTHSHRAADRLAGASLADAAVFGVIAGKSAALFAGAEEGGGGEDAAGVKK